MPSEELGGSTAQTQAQVDPDGQGETDTGSTGDQEDARGLDPICPGDRSEGSVDERTKENAAN